MDSERGLFFFSLEKASVSPGEKQTRLFRGIRCRLLGLMERGTERSAITRFMWRERIISAPRRCNKRGGSQRENCSLSRARRVVAGRAIRKWRRLASGDGKGGERWETGDGLPRWDPPPAPSHNCMEFKRRERWLPIRPYLAFRFPSIPRNNRLFRDPDEILAAPILPRVFAQLRRQL